MCTEQCPLSVLVAGEKGTAKEKEVGAEIEEAEATPVVVTGMNRMEDG